MNDLVNKGSSDMVEASKMLDAWGGNEMSAQDIVIPKLLLMQGMSDQVTAKKAAMGDYINSITGEILGSVEKPIECIPFHMEKFWVHNKFNGKKWVFDFIEKMTPQNQSDPWEYVNPKGEKCKRIYTLNFFVLIAKQPLPFVLSFSGTSAKTGKELATQMYTINALSKLPPPAKAIELFGKIDKNDDGTYAVKQYRVKRDSTQEEVLNAFNWYNTIKGGAAKVEEGVPF